MSPISIGTDDLYILSINDNIKDHMDIDFNDNSMKISIEINYTDIDKLMYLDDHWDHPGKITSLKVLKDFLKNENENNANVDNVIKIDFANWRKI